MFSSVEEFKEYYKTAKYNGCAREAFMWAIATGCAMALHRWRMGTRTQFVVHSFFGTTSFLAGSTYYLCYTNRIWTEQNIEETMKIADIRKADETTDDEAKSRAQLYMKPADNDEDIVLGKDVRLYQKGDNKR